ncbi:MAG: glycosyltransferase family 4 protein [Bacteroidota bacterium]
MKRRNPGVLMVGSDLTSNGGIASVIKTLYASYSKSDFPFRLFLLKTCYYNDKGILWELFILIKAILVFTPIIIKHNVKIVHLHTSSNLSYYRTIIFFFISKLLRRKTILHFHASNFSDFFIHNNKSYKLNKFVFKHTDQILVLCNEWKNQLMDKYGIDNATFLPNPIPNIPQEVVKETEAKSNKCFQILFIGFLIKTKGIIEIIELATLLKKNKVNAKIIIAGKGLLHDFIITEIENKELSEYLEYFGWANEVSKTTLYLNSDLFLLPSYKEGMPITILEAMTYGLPIISTNIAGIPDEVVHAKNGFLYQPGDVSGFYNGITTLINNKELRVEMRKESLKKVKSFDSSVIFNRLLLIYKELL